MNPAPDSRLPRGLLSIATLWLLALAGGNALTGALGLTLNAHGHAHLYAHGHPFVDARTLLGIPNAMDVLSNLPLLIAGLWGWLNLRGTVVPTATRRAATVFFAGLLLTGAGSALYHWTPSAETLVWDRLGMAVTFAGALSMALAERAGKEASRDALGWLLAAALLSALLPAANGNVLPWVVVQFGGMALIVALTFQQPVSGAIGIRLGALIGLYALAKALELGDAAVFHATTETISGHSLKHLAAACAAAPVFAALRHRRQSRRPRPTCPTPSTR